MLILHETYDHWSVAVLTVTVHSSFFPTFDFLKICCFLHYIQSVNPHFYVTLYYNGSLYIGPYTETAHGSLRFFTKFEDVNIEFMVLSHYFAISFVSFSDRISTGQTI